MDHIKVELQLEQYISGLVSRGAKPWNLSSNKGISIGDINYDWVQIRTLVHEQKAKDRKYVSHDGLLDDAIWDAYINFKQPWSETSNLGSYGLKAKDVQVSWKKFEELVDNGCFTLTDERNSILNNIEQACPDIPSVPNSPIEGDPYEII
ncbi:MAG: hypothetical protein ACRC1D_03190 [Culicoidibacterales bacterium]